MKRSKLDDGLRERIALEVLEVLDAPTAAALDAAIAALDPRERSAAEEERAALRAVAADLALATPPVAPPAGLRARLLDTVRSGSAAAGPGDPRASEAGATTDPGFLFVVASDEGWESIGHGVSRKLLAGEPGQRSRSYLIRLEPGARVRTHAHPHDEHCLVISGDLRIGGRTLRAGDYHRAAAGSVHDGLTSASGCTALIVEAAA